MLKRDPIFWTASAIFVLSLVLAATVHEIALLLMPFSYLLRPTLHALALARRYADERQLTDQYRSGHIAFTVVVTGLIVLAAERQINSEPADAYFALLCIGIAAKALANRMLGRDWRPIGITIVLSVAALMTLFGLIEEGLTFAGLMHSIPGLILAAVGVTGIRYPRAAGLLTAVAAAFAIYFFKLYLLRQLPTFLLIVVPLFIASACLFFGRESASTESETTA
jgi:hypothetical protein